MSRILGTGPIKLGSDTVLEIGGWTIDMNADTKAFVDVNNGWEQNDYGALKAAGSAKGGAALEDTTGQDLIEAALLNKTKITDVKFYLKGDGTTGEKNVYYAPAAGTGGMLVTACNINKDGGSEMSEIAFSFVFDGEIERTVETVT